MTLDVFSNWAGYCWNDKVYKARGRPNTTCNGQMCHGVAFAQHWLGPYVKLTPHKPIGPPPGEGCECVSLFHCLSSFCFAFKTACSRHHFARVR